MIYVVQGPKNYLKLCDKPSAHHNRFGLIENNGTLNIKLGQLPKVPRSDPTFVKSPNGSTKGVGGTGYDGWIVFASQADALKYLAGLHKVNIYRPQSIGFESEINKINKSICDWIQAKQAVLAPGKILPEWPEVILSEDDPPIFKTNKRLKEIYEEDEAEGFLDYPPDFEKLLGCYIPSKQTIILWIKGIELCSRRLFAGRDKNGQEMIGIPFENLLTCVYVHELGHWFSHVAHTANDITWDSQKISVIPSPGQDEIFGYSPEKDSSLPELPNGFQIHELMHYLVFPVDSKFELEIKSFGDAYSCSSDSYHEVWAQWLAWLYGCEKDSGALEAFEVLERLQSRPYKAWRKLVNSAPNPDRGLYNQKSYILSDLRYTQKQILDSLEWSRSHRIPVTFDNPNHKATNMLLWLKSIPKAV
jgi:hypothetical protein